MVLLQAFVDNLLDGDYCLPSKLLVPKIHLTSLHCNPQRPRRKTILGKRKNSESIDKDKFLVNLDVQHFAPEDITVKTLGDNTICVEGEHEEKEDDHGTVWRHFKRRYVLPEGHDLHQVSTKLSSDGVLTITAPKITTSNKGERVIPIEHTGPVRPALEKKAKEEENSEDRSNMEH